jgi:hypothetical protein
LRRRFRWEDPRRRILSLFLAFSPSRSRSLALAGTPQPPLRRKWDVPLHSPPSLTHHQDSLLPQNRPALASHWTLNNLARAHTSTRAHRSNLRTFSFFFLILNRIIFAFFLSHCMCPFYYTACCTGTNLAQRRASKARAIHCSFEVVPRGVPLRRGTVRTVRASTLKKV